MFHGRRVLVIGSLVATRETGMVAVGGDTMRMAIKLLLLGSWRRLGLG